MQTRSSSSQLVSSGHVHFRAFLTIFSVLLLLIVTLSQTGERVKGDVRQDVVSMAPTSCVSAPPNLVSWWRAEGDANDSIGSNSGTMLNGANFASGEVGQGFSFDGNSQYVEIQHSNSINPTSAITLETWVKVNSLPGGNPWAIVTKDAPIAGPYDLAVHNDGKVDFAVYTDAWHHIESPMGSIVPGNFAHIAGTFDSVTGQLCVYVNATSTCTSIQGTMPQRNALKIGASPFWGTFVNGIIDELSLYNRALSASEIQSIYNAGSAGKCYVSTPTPTPTNTATATPTPWTSFAPGNLVIYRIGDGVAALSSVATAVFLDEYTTAGTLVQTIPLPTSVNGSNRILTAQGNSVSEGFLSRSLDGQFLVLQGYDKAPGGTAPSVDPPTTTNRVIGRVNAAGVSDTTTALDDPTNNIRGVASTNGLDLWFTTSSSGIRYTALGNVGSSTQLSTMLANLRVPSIFDGQLYASSASSSFRLATIGTGTPTTSGQTITNLPGFPTTGAPYGHFFADLDSNVQGMDTVYVADDVPGTIQKYSLVAGSWTANGTINLNLARGLTGSVIGTDVTLYVTAGGTTLQTLTDTSGHNGTITGTLTSLATAQANTAFRGVAFAPVFVGPTPTQTATATASPTPTNTRTNTPTHTPTSTLTPTPTPCTNEVIALRSGNGAINTTDSQIKMLVGPADSPFPAPFTTGPGGQFEQARTGPPASIIARHSDWIGSLTFDPSAQYISDNFGGASFGGSVLYAIPFTANSTVGSAKLDLYYAVDNFIGSAGLPGIYINEQAVGCSSSGIGDFHAQYEFHCDVTDLLTGGGGMNTLYINSTDVGGPAGIIFSVVVTITPPACVTPTPTSTNTPTPTPPPADLQVTSVTAPGQAFTDSSFDLSWTDSNAGVGSAIGPWVDRIFLSADNQVGSDTPVAEFSFSGSVEPAQSAARTQVISIPRSAVPASGQYYLIVVTDANNNIIEGVNEGNNTNTRAINVTRTPYPDLIVENITAPSTAFFGQTIQVQWTIKNIGTVPTNAPVWSDWYYISADNVPEIEDPFRAHQQNISYLDPGESYTATADITIPTGLVGNYNILVWTDGDGTNHQGSGDHYQVYEENEINNWNFVAPITINAPPLPDLVPTVVQAPDEAFAGQPATFNWRVENHGSNMQGSPDTWTDSVYLSQDTTFSASSDRLIGSRQHTGPLAQNQGYDVTNFSVTLPNNIVGNWYVFVLTDSQNAVYEFTNESNNADYDRTQPGSPMLVHVTPPDLIVPMISVTGTPTAGGQLTVNWTVQNQGAFAAAPAWFDTVYLAASSTPNPAADTVMANVYHPTTLGPGLTYNDSSIITLPNCLTGPYYLYVFADRANQVFEYDPGFDAEANNLSQLQAIQITSTPPDLRVTAVSNPSNAAAGQPMGVTWTVANIGAGATAQNSWVDSVYLSASSTFNAGSVSFLGSFTHTGDLAPGGSYQRTENVTIPASAEGIYYVFVVTDTSGNVTECSGEGNNTSTTVTTVSVSNMTAPPPDLQITGVTAPGSAFTGETITAQWNGINSGNGPVPNSAWNDAVYISTDTTLDPTDARLAVKLVPGPLAAAATYFAQVQVTIPQVAAGNYYLIVNADEGNFVFEGQNEGNNTNNGSISISIPQIDLQVSAVTVPVNGLSGQNLAVNWTVTNTGTTQTFASGWTDNVILSRDQILDLTDQVIGYYQRSGTLASGASYSPMINAAIPAGLSGPWYIFVSTDVHNNVSEGNEANNVTAPQAVSIQIPPASDLIVSNVVIPGSGAPGEPVTINWTVANQGANAAGGDWTDAVYLSTDAVWNNSDTLVGRVQHDGGLLVGQNYVGQLNTNLPAVNPGPFYVIVRCDVLNQVRETTKANNTAASSGTMAVDVPELTLGVPYNTTLQTGLERFHKVNVPFMETLLYTLHSTQSDAQTELFAKQGSIASRSNFDYLFDRPGDADQQIVVPDTQAGYYYDLARGAYIPGGTVPVSIKAEIIPFSIRSVSPNRIGDNGQVTITLHGARFQNGATVKLVSSSTMLTAALVMVPDSANAKARFFFTNAPHGVYDVVITNPGGAVATATGAVAIETASQPTLNVDTVGNTRARLGRRLSLTSTLKNTGNVDVPYSNIYILFTQENSHPFIGINRPTGTLPKQSDQPGANWADNSPTTIYAGATTRDSFIVRDLEPGGEVPFSTSIRDYRSGPYNLMISATANSADDFDEQMRTRASELRTALLGSNSEFPAWLNQALATESTWWQYINSGLIEAGWLDSAMGVPRALHAKSKNLSDLRKWETNKLAARKNLRSKRLDSLNPVLPDSSAALGLQNQRTEQSDCPLCDLSHTSCEISAIALTVACALTFSALPPVALGCLINYLAPAVSVTGGICGAINTACNASCTGEVSECDIIKMYEGRLISNVIGCSIFVPVDPNDKIGPSGSGPQAYVGGQNPVPYTVNFENIATATGAAQRIRITDQLDPDLDPRTFRLTEIGFGNYRVTIPENRSFYQIRLQLGEDLNNLQADISAFVDIGTGQVTWTLTAIDPATGEQPIDAALGLLPPNDSTGRGQGYVSYTVKPKSSAITGAEIANKATIVFDIEEPIVTNTVTNTLDADAPTSSVAALPAVSDPMFTLSWSGTDPVTGSGLQSFDIWESKDNGPYQPFLTGTTDNSAEFTGQPGSSYRFYSTARDNAGNVETAHLTPDAITTIAGGTPSPTNTPTATATPTNTPTNTATNTPTPTPTVPPVITGVVTYGNAIGAPTPRFVSHVLISAAGSTPISVFTGAPGPTAGQYSLTGFGTGSYTITPTKSGGANNITSFDAAKIAQHVAGIALLTGNQLLVADVSNNGMITSFDAANIAKYVVSSPPFGITGIWKFSPVSRTHSTVNANFTGEDYSALLMGEVSGNWNNTGARPANGPERSAAINLPRLVTRANNVVIIPVIIQRAANKGIISYEFDLRYDPSVIRPAADPIDLVGTVSRGLSFAVNADEPGLLRVVMYGAFPINRNGLLLNLMFNAVGAPGSVSPLTFERSMFNEGDPRVTVTDGQVELLGAATGSVETVRSSTWPKSDER